MKDRIKIIIDNYLENNRGIQKKYIEKIIYITDTDRCFIDNDYIYFGEKIKSFVMKMMVFIKTISKVLNKEINLNLRI